MKQNAVIDSSTVPIYAADPIVPLLVLPWDWCLHDNHRLMPVIMGKWPKQYARLTTAPEYRKAKLLAWRYFRDTWKVPKLSGDVTLVGRAFFPDRRKRDAGNYRKLITDALSGVAYGDDQQIVKETWEFAAIDRVTPRFELTLSGIFELAL